MKKIAFILIVVMMFLNLAACGFVTGVTTPDTNDQQDSSNPPADDSNKTPDDKDPVDDPKDDPVDNPNDDPVKDPVEQEKPDNVNSHLISVNGVRGLNEEIMVMITPVAGFSYNIYYQNKEDGEFSKLDKNLIIEKDGMLECYILGIKKGNYKVKIEAESETEYAARTYEDISVEAQDRSGYAHFGYSEGIGAYNNDGTLKEGTKIVYVTNENKNTVTLEIDGVEYVGLVNILQAQYKSDTPMLIRIIGRISTNQWNYKNVAPRLADGSNSTDDFFENTFSTEYGENLANLIVKINDKGACQTFNYKTTATGLTEVRITGSGKSTTTYKGSDFPALKGKIVYDDDSYYNMLEVKGSKNITIEGIGTDAEIFQFGIGFENCNSIEIKNLTFTDYPEDALNFLGNDAEVTDNGNCWVHNNTFNKGYNAWDISGERDKYAGDGTVDMAIVKNITLSYNYYNSCKKTMLVGNSDSSRCLNITLHHNYFFNVGSRIPLARNTNIHSFNNYYSGCSTCGSIRVTSYLFSEANYFQSCSKPFDIDRGAVKSYGDIFVSSNSGNAVIATSRDQAISNNCKPDTKTDYSKFDTDPTLFYYDAEKGTTIADYLLAAEDVPDFVLKYAGAGVKNKLPTK